MWPERFFPNRYWPARYFPKEGQEAATSTGSSLSIDQDGVMAVLGGPYILRPTRPPKATTCRVNVLLPPLTVAGRGEVIGSGVEEILLWCALTLPDAEREREQLEQAALLQAVELFDQGVETVTITYDEST